VGWTRLPGLNPLGIVVYVLLTGIVVLVVWRATGHQPLQRDSASAAARRAGTRGYVLVGRIEEKVYYFDEQAESVFEYDPAQPGQQRYTGSIPSVETALVSPERDRIALLSTEKKGHSGIYLLDPLDVGDLMLVTTQASGLTPGYAIRVDSAMSWSPRGRQIAFVAHNDEGSDLFVSAVDGSRTQRVTYNEASISSVTWVDPETIAFVSDWEGQDLIYRIDADGGNLRRLR
jgi:hypothetical protein